MTAPLNPLDTTPFLQPTDADSALDQKNRAGVDFVALFVGEVFKSMRATCHENDGSFAQGVFVSMLDEQLAQHMAVGDVLHLQDTIADGLAEKSLKI